MRTPLVLALFVAAFVALRVGSYTQLSATWDEPMHLTAGYLALTQQDFRVDPSHPPFMRAWAALPLLMTPIAADATEIDRTAVRDWFGRGYDFARRFLYAGTDADADTVLSRARFMIVIWGCVLGLLVFAWAHEWLGFGPAVAALAFYTLEPNLAAHAGLVTTDFGIACFLFAAVYFLWRVSVRFSAWNVAGLAASVALAAVTKFSAVLLGPIVVILLVVAVVRGSALTPRRAAITIAVLAAATVAAIWAAYGFRYLPSGTAAWVITPASIDGREQLPLLTAVLGWIDRHHLLPNAYTQGLLYSQASSRLLPGFLAGDVQAGGWWYYFPAAFALKTPLALLLLGAAGCALLLARRRRWGLTPVFLFVGIAVCLGTAMASGINIGLRHILPIYPFVLLIAAAAVKGVLDRGGRAAPIALAMVVLLWGAEFAQAYPYTLTFFNAAGGGSRNGFNYLADSNLGWGGNLKPLKRWMDEHEVRTINLAYFGTAEPEYYGISATYLPGSATYLQARIARPVLPGYVAVSATVLNGVYLQPWWRLFYAGLREREPVAIVGHSLRVYWVESWPEAASLAAADPDALEILSEGLLFGLKWPEHAIPHYREYLQRVPANPTAWKGLAVALAQTGQLTEATVAFRRVVELAPADGQARQNLAALEAYAAGPRAFPSPSGVEPAAQAR